jgi:hypothetical protein
VDHRRLRVRGFNFGRFGWDMEIAPPGTTAAPSWWDVFTPASWIVPASRAFP